MVAARICSVEGRGAAAGRAVPVADGIVVSGVIWGAQEAPATSARTARASSSMALNRSAKLGSTEDGLTAHRAYCSPRNAAFAPLNACARISTPAIAYRSFLLGSPSIKMRRPRRKPMPPSPDPRCGHGRSASGMPLPRRLPSAPRPAAVVPSPGWRHRGEGKTPPEGGGTRAAGGSGKVRMYAADWVRTSKTRAIATHGSANKTSHGCGPVTHSCLSPNNYVGLNARTSQDAWAGRTRTAGGWACSPDRRRRSDEIVRNRTDASSKPGDVPSSASGRRDADRKRHNEKRAAGLFPRRAVVSPRSVTCGSGLSHAMARPERPADAEPGGARP